MMVRTVLQDGDDTSEPDMLVEYRTHIVRQLGVVNGNHARLFARAQRGPWQQENLKPLIENFEPQAPVDLLRRRARRQIREDRRCCATTF